VTVEPLSAEPPHRILRPSMRQSWCDLTFLHWRCDPAAVRPLLPAALDLDCYDGSAWIGLVPFYISGLTLPRAPAVPWLSHFPETNVRTYVVDRHGLRGAWFFSLDAARLPAVIGARAGYALPYFWAHMAVYRQSDVVRYWSRRIAGPPAGTEIDVTAGPRIAHPTELEIFLTARFRLYARRGATILKADVEHPPWPLRQARATRLNESLIPAAGLPRFTEAPLVHFSDRVDVLVAAPQRT
jgi:uncharacterized protein YqjF (DUF2071 family)